MSVFDLFTDNFSLPLSRLDSSQQPRCCSTAAAGCGSLGASNDCVIRWRTSARRPTCGPLLRFSVILGLASEMQEAPQARVFIFTYSTPTSTAHAQVSPALSLSVPDSLTRRYNRKTQVQAMNYDGSVDLDIRPGANPRQICRLAAPSYFSSTPRLQLPTFLVDPLICRPTEHNCRPGLLAQSLLNHAIPFPLIATSCFCFDCHLMFLLWAAADS